MSGWANISVGPSPGSEGQSLAKGGRSIPSQPIRARDDHMPPLRIIGWRGLSAYAGRHDRTELEKAGPSRAFGLRRPFCRRPRV